jgi:hypothetical protein
MGCQDFATYWEALIPSGALLDLSLATTSSTGIKESMTVQRSLQLGNNNWNYFQIISLASSMPAMRQTIALLAHHHRLG